MTTKPVFNFNIKDNSKGTLDDAHIAAFGYGVNVDPFSFEGPAVAKSILNATHDGTIVDLPQEEVKEDVVYQRLLGRELPGDRIEEFRIPVMGGVIPFVYIKSRPKSVRFNASRQLVTLHGLNAVLSTEEVDSILDLCRILGLDYGELDAMRDPASDKLYVIDANPTPSGLPIGIGMPDYWKALGLLSASFAQMIFRKSNREQVS